ncbi:MAG: peptidylprolyl isomerase [Bacillus sp. (in: firmicutes)]
MKKIQIMGLLSMLLLAACGKMEEPADESLKGKQAESLTTIEEYPQFMPVQDDEKVVMMKTSKGTIEIKLFPAYAPKAVENFIAHAKDGYYDGLKFHRVIQNFMIQGGDPKGTGRGGESIWGRPFEDEFSDKLYNFRGALSMANAGPDSNGSQFFIVQANNENMDQIDFKDYQPVVAAAYKETGGAPWLDGMHTVFGQVVKGMEIVDKIAGMEVDAQDAPVEDIIITSIKVVQ